jgi:hypothetical protein
VVSGGLRRVVAVRLVSHRIWIKYRRFFKLPAKIEKLFNLKR